MDKLPSNKKSIICFILLVTRICVPKLLRDMTQPFSAVIFDVKRWWFLVVFCMVMNYCNDLGGVGEDLSLYSVPDKVA